MSNIRKYITNNLLFLIVVLQPLLDILAYFQQDSAISIAGYARLAFTILIPLYTLIVTNQKKKFLVIMCGIGGFAALHVANGFRVGYISLTADVKYLLLVLYMPLLLISFSFLFKKEELKNQIIRGLRANAVIIVVAFFASYVLKNGNYTYADYEVGWTGWYVIPNAQSVIMVSILPFMVYFLITYFKKFFPIPLALIVYMYMLNGTKTSYFSVLLVLLGFACFMVMEFLIKREGKFPVYNTVMLVLVICTTIFAYNYSPREIIDENEAVARKEEQNKIDELEHLDRETILKNLDKDLLDRFGDDRVLEAYGDEIDSYTFADMRLKKRVYGKLVWEESDFLTKLVGFEYPKMQHNGENFDLENDPPAILYYYGYIGAAAYICLIVYFVLRLLTVLVRKFKESLSCFNFAILITWGLQMGLSVYAGYLLRRPNVSFYLLIVLLLVYCQTEALKKGKEEA